MHINSVVSVLGAWRNLQENNSAIIDDLIHSIGDLDASRLGHEDRRYVRPQRSPSTQTEVENRNLISMRDLHRFLEDALVKRGWQARVRLSRNTRRFSSFFTIDFVKDGVGLELGLGKAAFIESRIFVGFPRLVQGNVIQTAITLVRMASLARQMSAGVANFEFLDDMLQETAALPLKYPLAIVGFSENRTSLEVTELTSQLDAFLVKSLGMTIEEMALVNEQPNYDFKVQLPRNEKLAQEVCGFANLRGGGCILLGVDKYGRTVGLPKGKDLDDIQLKIANVISDSCNPRPRFETFIFDHPRDAALVILVVRIHELERKPCTAHQKVYVRAGPSARVADPEEIRRLVLG